MEKEIPDVLAGIKIGQEIRSNADTSDNWESQRILRKDQYMLHWL